MNFDWMINHIDRAKLSAPAHDRLLRDSDKTQACRFDPMRQRALRDAQRARRTLQRLAKDGAQDQTRGAPACQLDRQPNDLIYTRSRRFIRIRTLNGPENFANGSLSERCQSGRSLP
jgi:hypothetical protein